MKEKILKPPKKAPRTLINPPISNSAIERIIFTIYILCYRSRLQATVVGGYNINLDK